MIFGMPTLIENKNIEESVLLCKELGLSFVELNMNLPMYQPQSINVEHLKSLSQKYGVGYTIHLDENLNISDFNPYVAKAYEQTVVDTIRLAKELGVRILNMHLSKGVYFTLPDKKVFLFDEYKGQYLESMADFRDRCGQEIGDSNIKICVENSNGYTGFQKGAIDILLESPVFGLTFDVGHNYCIGGVDESVIMDRAQRLCHLHLHDAKDKKDHLTLGTGELDIEKYLRLAEEKNLSVVLETKTVEGLTKSVKYVRDIR